MDRAEWLTELAQTGSWDGVRRLRKRPRLAQGRLKDSSGQLVSSEHRADTMAAYLETVQWAVRPAQDLPDRPPLGPELPVPLGDFLESEVKSVVRKLIDNKACGQDGLPAEYWKALFADETDARKWLVQFCQRCCSAGQVPDDWHLARVSTIFKKGDPAECGIYHAIF